MATLADRLIEVADAAWVLVSKGWQSSVREYVNEQTLESLDRRLVSIQPLGYKTVEVIDRGENLNEYRLWVCILEKFAQPGAPTKDWLDGQLRFVGSEVYDVLNIDPRKYPDPADRLLGSLWCETIEVTEACRPETILAQRMFWSEIEVAFREITSTL